MTSTPDPRTSPSLPNPLDQGRARPRQPCLTMIFGPSPGRLFLLAQDDVLIGRAELADVSVEEPGVSREHARLRLDEGVAARVTDLASTNGTWVNGARVESGMLQPGDKLRLGSTVVLRYDRLDAMDVAFAEQLFHTSTTDVMTECRNRRFFESELPREVAFAKRTGGDLTLALRPAPKSRKL